ncbi:MAG: hypothetical protein IJE46_02785 [Clostridia bacterium]|nr:hypothetical protein [Clostridia bacterium]
MLFEILFCFFTVFGIMQLMALLWEMFFSKIPSDAALIVKVDENTDFKVLCSELKNQKANVVFVYDDINEKKLKILEKNFEFARFISKDSLTNELSRII